MNEESAGGSTPAATPKSRQILRAALATIPLGAVVCAFWVMGMRTSKVESTFFAQIVGLLMGGAAVLAKARNTTGALLAAGSTAGAIIVAQVTFQHLGIQDAVAEGVDPGVFPGAVALWLEGLRAFDVLLYIVAVVAAFVPVQYFAHRDDHKHFMAEQRQKQAARRPKLPGGTPRK